MKVNTFTAIMSCALLGTACGGSEVLGPESEMLEILENLVVAGFPENDMLVTSEGKVYVGRDAHVTLEASREMVASDSERFDEFENARKLEQYRTRNVVRRDLREICIDGSRFSGALSQGLDLAIENYNQLGLTFRMRRGSGGCGAQITAIPISGSGGSAGFPSGGSPYPQIQIGEGNARLGVDLVEHVITHELGHAVGLRHSDYFDRSISCGAGGNEGDGGVGAIHIPGTPTGASVGGSIMNSCFRRNESGEFTGSDRVALQSLYR